MATYPGGIPALGTRTAADTVDEAHINTAAREIEAMCAAMGINPLTISDTAAIDSTPDNVAEFLSNACRIVKEMANVDAWYKAAVPNRIILTAHGGGGAVAAATSGNIGPGGLNTVTDTTAEIRIPYAGKLVVRRFYAEIFASGGGDNKFHVELTTTGINAVFYLRPTAAAGVYYGVPQRLTADLTLAANSKLCFSVQNEAGVGGNFTVGSMSVEMDITG